MTIVKSLLFSVLVLPLFLVTIPISTTEACSADPISSISTPLVLPSDGQNAPLNTKVWVTPLLGEYVSDTTPLDSTDIELRSEGMLIEISAKAISVQAVFENHLWVLEPVELLSPGQIVEVWIRGKKISDFVVSSTELLTPPSPPTLESVDISGEEFGLLFCGESSRISVTVQDSATLLLLSEQSPVSELPTSALAIGFGQHVAALEVEAGHQRLQITAVDLAGNLSVPTPLPEFTVPPTVTGCALSGAQQWPSAWTLLLFVLIVLRPNRQKRNT